MCYCQFVTHLVSQSWVEPCLYFGSNIRNIAFLQKIHKIQNISMLNMYMFDVISVCHSLGQSVLGRALFIIWLKHQKYSFLQKIYKNIEYLYVEYVHV